MVIMDNYYQDRLTELWSRIDKLHLKYLDIEESPEKIEIRNKLEDFIREYLCMASHSNKFSLPVTYEVLYRSANRKPDFSAYKAATGFDALQLYAGNLVSQPWRKEYKRIRKYSGFYKHNVESNLVNAEFILEAMGYKPIGISTLILDGPIGPDKVITVSKDCLIAYVECQIVKAIWEEMASSKMNISWLEILDFRQTHLCSPEQSIRGLKMQYQQKHYQEHIRNNSSLNMHHAQTNYLNHSILPLASEHLSAPALIPQYLYGTNGCCQNSCMAEAQMQCQPYHSSMSYATHNIMKPQFNSNGYYYSNGYNTPVPNYNNTVPIAQLIEVEPQDGFDMLDRPSYSRIPLRSHNFNDVYAGFAEDSPNKEIDSDKTDSQFEGWDYVYKKLDSQGYNKDLGDRGDVLSLGLDGKPKQQSLDKKKKDKELSKKIKSLEVNVNALTLSKSNKATASEKATKPKRTDKIEVSPASSYDNLPQDKKTKTSNLTVSKTKTPSRDKSVNVAKAKVSKLKTENASWQCKSCTYLNIASTNICEMCSKSKSNVEEEVEVGGAECENCTLVNPKDVKICQACDKSLENSATRV